MIGSIDIFQLVLLKGWPPLMSSHMLTSFKFVRIQNSMRAIGDQNFCKLKKLTRLTPSEITPAVEKDFTELLGTTCTFVSSFEDRRIPSTATFVLSKRKLCTKIQNEVVEKLKREKRHIICQARDEEITIEGDWIDASHLTKSFLDQYV